MSVQFAIASNEYFSSTASYSPPVAGSLSMWMNMLTVANNDRPLGSQDAFELRTDVSAIYNELYWASGGALSYSITANVMYHWVFTWDYNAGTGNVTHEIYRDGVSVAGPRTSANTMTTTVGTLHIGASRSTPTGFVDAIMHDVRFYHRVITAAEVAEIYACRGTDQIFDDLAHRFLFNEVAPGANFSVNSINEIAGGFNLTPTNTPIGAESILAQIRRIA